MIHLTFDYGEQKVTMYFAWGNRHYKRSLPIGDFQAYCGTARQQRPFYAKQLAPYKSHDLTKLEIEVRMMKIARERVSWVPHPGDIKEFKPDHRNGHLIMYLSVMEELEASGIRLLSKERINKDAVYLQHVNNGPEVMYIKNGVITQARMFAKQDGTKHYQGWANSDLPLASYTPSGRWANSEYEYMAREGVI